MASEQQIYEWLVELDGAIQAADEVFSREGETARWNTLHNTYAMKRLDIAHRLSHFRIVWDGEYGQHILLLHTASEVSDE